MSQCEEFDMPVYQTRVTVWRGWHAHVSDTCHSVKSLACPCIRHVSQCEESGMPTYQTCASHLQPLSSSSSPFTPSNWILDKAGGALWSKNNTYCILKPVWYRRRDGSVGERGGELLGSPGSESALPTQLLLSLYIPKPYLWFPLQHLQPFCILG